MASKVSAIRFWRSVHLYFGLFIAPAMIFFAFTGIAQTLSLHEAAGTSYKPPAWLTTLGQIHKKQTSVLPARRPAAAGPSSGRSPNNSPALHHRPAITPGLAENQVSAGATPAPTLASKERQHLPLKIFFLIASFGLFISTLTGIYMAFVYKRSRLLIFGALAAGTVLPLVLLRF